MLAFSRQGFGGFDSHAVRAALLADGSKSVKKKAAAEGRE
jgi:hypothetical protein